MPEPLDVSCTLEGCTFSMRTPDGLPTSEWYLDELVTAFGDRAIVRVQGSIQLGSHSEPQPDLAADRQVVRGRTRLAPVLTHDFFPCALDSCTPDD